MVTKGFSAESLFVSDRNAVYQRFRLGSKVPGAGSVLRWSSIATMIVAGDTIMRVDKHDCRQLRRILRGNCLGDFSTG